MTTIGSRPQVIDGRVVVAAAQHPAPPNVPPPAPVKPAEAFDWKQWEQITRIAAQKARDDAAAKRGQVARLEVEIAELESTAKRLERAIGVVGSGQKSAAKSDAGAIRSAIERWADAHDGEVALADFARSMGRSRESIGWHFSGRYSLCEAGRYERIGRGVYRRVAGASK